MLNIPNKKQNKNRRVNNIASGDIPVTCQNNAFSYFRENILVKMKSDFNNIFLVLLYDECPKFLIIKIKHLNSTFEPDE